MFAVCQGCIGVFLSIISFISLFLTAIFSFYQFPLLYCPFSFLCHNFPIFLLTPFISSPFSLYFITHFPFVTPFFYFIIHFLYCITHFSFYVTRSNPAVLYTEKYQTFSYPTHTPVIFTLHFPPFALYTPLNTLLILIFQLIPTLLAKNAVNSVSLKDFHFFYEPMLTIRPCSPAPHSRSGRQVLGAREGSWGALTRPGCCVPGHQAKCRRWKCWQSARVCTGSWPRPPPRTSAKVVSCT